MDEFSERQELPNMDELFDMQVLYIALYGRIALNSLMPQADYLSSRYSNQKLRHIGRFCATNRVNLHSS